MTDHQMKNYRVTYEADMNFYSATRTESFQAQSDWQAQQIARWLSGGDYYSELMECRIVPRPWEHESSEPVLIS